VLLLVLGLALTRDREDAVLDLDGDVVLGVCDARNLTSLD